MIPVPTSVPIEWLSMNLHTYKLLLMSILICCSFALLFLSNLNRYIGLAIQLNGISAGASVANAGTNVENTGGTSPKEIIDCSFSND